MAPHTPDGRTAAPHKGTLHVYTDGLVAFEHLPHPPPHPPPPPPASSAEPPSEPPPPPTNHLIFIAGLTEGLLNVPYASALAAALPPSWSLVSVLLSSSYRGWATGSLAQDADDLDKCVRYFRALHPHSAAKVVLMGHSTGCQDAMHYLTGPHSSSRAPIDGVVFQASVSDREAMSMILSPSQMEESVALARDWMAAGRGDDVMPASASANLFGIGCSARRWLSLASPDHDGEDDLFSSDLSDAQLAASWGKIPARSPVLILYSAQDQFVPPHVDKAALVRKWGWDFVESSGDGVLDKENSGLVHGATHNLKGCGEEVVGDLVQRVTRFVARLDGDEFREQVNAKKTAI